MKYLYLVLISALCSNVFFSCSKSNDSTPPETEDKFIVTSVSPDPRSAYLGCVVTLTGMNFIADTSKIWITLGGGKVPVTSATTEKITFTVPANLTTIGPDEKKEYAFALGMEDRSGDTSITLRLNYHESQGWYYAPTLPLSAKQTGLYVTFPTEQIGFIMGSGYLYRTTNGGISWERGKVSGGHAFASFDGQHCWMNYVNFVNTSDDYGTRFPTNTTGVQFDRSIIGMYMSSATTGLVAGQDQNLYYINGGFTRDKVGVKFTSKYFTAFPDSLYTRIKSIWSAFSVIDENNLMLSGSAIIGGKFTCIITHEKNGVFTEYDLGTVTNAPKTISVQLVDANTAFLIDGNYDILKLTGTTTWTKLNQKASAICFINATTGYAAYEGKILKTTNGGTTWQPEFTLQPDDTIYSMCIRNGKIWATGSNPTNLIALKYNP